MFPSIFNKLQLDEKTLPVKVNFGIKDMLTTRSYFSKLKHRKGMIRNHLHSSWQNFNI